MKLITTLTSMAAFSLLTATSQATIYWDFAQVNNDVVARIHGSFAVLRAGIGPSATGYGPSGLVQSSVAANAASSDGFLLRFAYFAPGELFYNLNYQHRGAPTASKQKLWSARPPSRNFGLPGGTILSSTGGLEFSSNTFRWSRDYGDTFGPSDVVDTTILYRNVTLASGGLDQSLTGTVLWQLRNTTNVGNAVVLRVSPSNVPEPSSTALAGLGVLILVIRRKR